MTQSCKTALILVDYQNDFCEGGALAVTGGLSLKSNIQTLLELPFFTTVATLDYHPHNHISFSSQYRVPTGSPTPTVAICQNPLNANETAEVSLWPDHCIAKTEGARFVTGFDTSRIKYVVRKGTVWNDEELSGFGSHFSNPTPPAPRVETFEQYLAYDTASTEEASTPKKSLEEFLSDQGITHLFLAGLALDFCVGSTMVDAFNIGLKVSVVRDCVAGIVPERIQDIDRFAASSKGRIEYITLSEVSARLNPTSGQSSECTFQKPETRLSMDVVGAGTSAIKKVIAPPRSYIGAQ